MSWIASSDHCILFYLQCPQGYWFLQIQLPHFSTSSNHQARLSFHLSFQAIRQQYFIAYRSDFRLGIFPLGQYHFLTGVWYGACWLTPQATQVHKISSNDTVRHDSSLLLLRNPAWLSYEAYFLSLLAQFSVLNSYSWFLLKKFSLPHLFFLLRQLKLMRQPAFNQTICRKI